MAKTESRPSSRKKQAPEALPFTRVNYQIMIVGLALILAGYIALSQEPWDGFMPLVLAPILLVLGYVVVIPLGILFRSKTEEVSLESAERSAS
ncbi:MAG: hypothetical protein MUE68_00765 [Bacteroidetes bacterium]|jgi:hypothetical protein|nr:hypothetical protein [Bacteroidota bacterium]